MSMGFFNFLTELLILLDDKKEEKKVDPPQLSELEPEPEPVQEEDVFSDLDEEEPEEEPEEGKETVDVDAFLKEYLESLKLEEKWRNKS